MIRFWKSFVFRLALFCGVLVIGSLASFSALFYFGTIRVLNHEIDRKLALISERLSDRFTAHGLDALQRDLDAILSDKVDVDTEIYYLAGGDGGKIAGNLSDWKELSPPLDRSMDRNVLRDGNPSSARLLAHRLPGAGLLIVGRDMKDMNELTHLVWRTIGIGCVVALTFGAAGTILFRHLLDRRVGTIRRTVEEIEAGDLSKRIFMSGAEDEFARLSSELNRMLDRIEHLMSGVRHVSNTIAHNLRTPLGRIRAHLDEALRNRADARRLGEAAEFSIEQIDALISVFNKLLQIAEAESGTKRQPFKTVEIGDVITNVVELYDAMAEDKGISLTTRIEGRLTTIGDRDLLASALANLLDNALRYGARSVAISAGEIAATKAIYVEVRDDGPGIPREERSKVTDRFYRLDQSVPGTGLGLSIVAAIVQLHGAVFQLEDAFPGLAARMVFPHQ